MAEGGASGNPLASLLDSWREEVALYEKRGLVESAAFLRSCIKDVETWWAVSESELLTANQAAAEMGLKPSTIRARWRDGRLPNEGGAGRPRVRRGTLREYRMERPMLEMVRQALVERAGR